MSGWTPSANGALSPYGSQERALAIASRIGVSCPLVLPKGSSLSEQRSPTPGIDWGRPSLPCSLNHAQHAWISHPQWRMTRRVLKKQVGGGISPPPLLCHQTEPRRPSEAFLAERFLVLFTAPLLSKRDNGILLLLARIRLFRPISGTLQAAELLQPATTHLLSVDFKSSPVLLQRYPWDLRCFATTVPPREVGRLRRRTCAGTHEHKSAIQADAMRLTFTAVAAHAHVTYVAVLANCP